MNRGDLSDESRALAPLTRATSNGPYAVDQRSPRRRPSVSRVETTVFRRGNRWIPQNKLMVSAFNWRSSCLSFGHSMRRWPLRKKQEKRCAYACRAPNLSLYHPICHPICHLLNVLCVNQLRRFGDRVTDFFAKKNWV